jgi:tetratricopeptide (TPR) repeat protein
MALRFLSVCFFCFAGGISAQLLKSPVSDENNLVSVPKTEREARQLVNQLMDIGQKYDQESRREEALTFYIQALSLEESLPEYNSARLRIHRTLSHILQELKAPGLAIYHGKLALDLYKHDEASDRKSLAVETYFMQGHIAAIYLERKKFDSAFTYFSMAYRTAEKMDEATVTAALNNLGIWYFEMGNYDSAGFYFQRALTLQEKNRKHNIGLRYSILDNQGQILFKTGRFSEALLIFQNNLQLADTMKNNKRRWQAIASVSETLLKLNKIKQANEWLAELERELDTSRHPQKFTWRQKAIALRINYFMATGNPGAALEFSKWQQRLNDSVSASEQKLLDKLYESIIQLRIGSIQRNFEIQKLKLNEKEKELEYYSQKAKFNSLLMIFTGSTGLLVILFLVFYFRKKSLIHKQEQDLLSAKNRLYHVELKNKQLESERMQAELENKKSVLADLSLYLEQLCSQNDQLFEDLASTRKLPAEEQQKAIKEIASRLQLKKNTGATAETLLKNIGELNGEFYNQLSKNFPGLSRSEKEMCGLLRLNMSSADIASLKNVSIKSVKMARYRLRKKLNLDSQADIYSFIRAI